MWVDFRTGTQFVLRLTLAILLITAGWNVLHQLVARQYVNGGADVTGISEAIEWNPADPEYHYRQGLAKRDLPMGQDLAEAERSLVQATRLNPFAWRYWIELARCYELRQKRDDAERTYLKAIELNPRSGEFYWRFANYYLRWGEREKALSRMKLALKWNPSFRNQTLPLLTRSDYSLAELLGIWPADLSSQLHLINYFVRNPIQQIEERELLAGCWEELLTSASPPSIGQGSFYIQHLLQTRPLEAREQWIKLAQINGLVDTDYQGEQNLVWNGHFETDISKGPLDWRIVPSENSRISQVRGEGFEGSTALRIDFVGSENPDFRALGVRLLTKPGKSHVFSFTSRSQEVTSDEGLYFQLIESSTGKVLLESAKILGTTAWTEYSGCFDAPNGTIVARLELRRNPSLRIDNLLTGTLWIDSVKLRPL